MKVFLFIDIVDLAPVSAKEMFAAHVADVRDRYYGEFKPIYNSYALKENLIESTAEIYYRDWKKANNIQTNHIQEKGLEVLKWLSLNSNILTLSHAKLFKIFIEDIPDCSICLTTFQQFIKDWQLKNPEIKVGGRNKKIKIK
jgi:hypothetical protein